MVLSVRGKLAWILAALLIGSLPSPVPAAEKPTVYGDQQALDRQIFDTLKAIHDKGADLYNGGDAAGCYRLLQGALEAVRPQLAQQPNIQKYLEAGLADAERHPKIEDRAFALHKLVEDVKEHLKVASKQPRPEPKLERIPEPKSTPDPETPEPELDLTVTPAAPLWDRLGGEAGVKTIVVDLTAMIVTDPKVDFTRGGKYQLSKDDMARFQENLVDYISQMTGGPFKYTGQGMKETHKGRGITDAEFDASVADLQEVLEKHKVNPADREAIRKAVETTRKDIVEEKKPR